MSACVMGGVKRDAISLCVLAQHLYPGPAHRGCQSREAKAGPLIRMPSNGTMTKPC